MRKKRSINLAYMQIVSIIIPVTPLDYRNHRAISRNSLNILLLYYGFFPFFLFLSHPVSPNCFTTFYELCSFRAINARQAVNSFLRDDIAPSNISRCCTSPSPSGIRPKEKRKKQLRQKSVFVKNGSDIDKKKRLLRISESIAVTQWSHFAMTKVKK